MRVRPACALVAAAALVGAATPCVCRAQRTASLEAGASYVAYDGFLGAGAGSLTGAVEWRRPRTTFDLRGTMLAFETGHASIQAAASGAAAVPMTGLLRLEAGAEAAASSYVTYARFGRLLAGARLHAALGAADLWLGPSAGMVATDGGTAAALSAGGGATLAIPRGALTAWFARGGVGDTAWSDAQAGLRLMDGPFELAASGGVRFASSGAGRGAYGDGAATWRLSDALAIVLAGGRYLSDPVRGTIPGGYVTLAFQVRHRTPRPSPAWAALGDRAAPAADSGAPGADARLAVREDGGEWLLTVTSTGAQRVEIMGDFTAWSPRPLQPSGGGTFTYRVRLAAGMYRFNIRLDGGAWIAPAGADTAPDEFGSVAAMLIVP